MVSVLSTEVTLSNVAINICHYYRYYQCIYFSLLLLLFTSQGGLIYRGSTVHIAVYHIWHVYIHDTKYTDDAVVAVPVLYVM